MISFKQAQIADIPQIVDLVNSAYRGETAKVGWTTEADILGGQRTDPGGIEEMILKPGARIELGLDTENRILGCVYLEHKEDSLYLGMLTVNPHLQSKGIGKELLLRSEAIAQELGLSQIILEVISIRSELIAFYERRGFQRTGATSPFPEHDPRFGLPKTKGLIFEEFIKRF
jgi:ribosomal protein S18 acetylase RimI-like enzyme